MNLKSGARMLVTLATLGVSCPGWAAGAELVDGIAALVGDSVITYEEVQRLIAYPLQTIQGRYAGEPEELRKAVVEVQRRGVESLVERQLILQEFAELKANIPESIIEDRVQAEIKKKYGDRTTAAKTLQEQGETFESLRKDIRETFIEAVMVSRNIPRDILISPGRIDRYYRENEEKFQISDQVKLRMIVIDRTRNPVDAVKLGREILAKLNDGADFGELAAVYSDGSQAREGGLWGWVDRKVLREDLAEIAFKMKAGERSDLIEKPEAVFLMLVEEVRVAHVQPLSEVREDIERTLINEEKARLQKEWIQRLRKKSFIRYF